MRAGVLCCLLSRLCASFRLVKVYQLKPPPVGRRCSCSSCCVPFFLPPPPFRITCSNATRSTEAPLSAPATAPPAGLVATPAAWGSLPSSAGSHCTAAQPPCRCSASIAAGSAHGMEGCGEIYCYVHHAFSSCGCLPDPELHSPAAPPPPPSSACSAPPPPERSRWTKTSVPPGFSTRWACGMPSGLGDGG